MKPLVIGLAALAALAAPASAHDYKIGSLHIVHPWARATPKGATVGGGYMKITNSGSAPDRLISGSTPVAERFEVHEMSMDNGVMRMRMLKDGLEIKPGETVELKPGSLHVMMVNLKQPIQEGQRFKGTLVFEKAGTVEVEYAIEPVGGSPKGHAPSGAAPGGHNH
jgi:copper(I)-binding protein